MEIKTVTGKQEIQLYVKGKITTVTSPDLEKAIMEAFQVCVNVVLDFEAVEYISSAGLRTLLLGRKTAISKGGCMRMVHVPDIVREVFQMTGFDKVLQIE